MKIIVGNRYMSPNFWGRSPEEIGPMYVKYPEAVGGFIYGCDSYGFSGVGYNIDGYRTHTVGTTYEIWEPKLRLHDKEPTQEKEQPMSSEKPSFIFTSSGYQFKDGDGEVQDNLFFTFQQMTEMYEKAHDGEHLNKIDFIKLVRTGTKGKSPYASLKSAKDGVEHFCQIADGQIPDLPNAVTTTASAKQKLTTYQYIYSLDNDAEDVRHAQYDAVNERTADKLFFNDHPSDSYTIHCTFKGDVKFTYMAFERDEAEDYYEPE